MKGFCGPGRSAFRVALLGMNGREALPQGSDGSRSGT